MKARNQRSLLIEVVSSEEEVDVEAFLRLYVAAILGEARRESAEATIETRHVEGRDEDATIPPVDIIGEPA